MNDQPTCENCNVLETELVTARIQISSLQDIQKEMLPIITGMSETMKYAEETIAELRKEIDDMKLLLQRSGIHHRAPLPVRKQLHRLN